MRDRPPLLSLEYFVATANLGTVRSAAEQLNVTPSAVSHQIARLEAFLGTPLFHRHKQRLILTDSGRQYLQQLEQSLDQILQATRDVAVRVRRTQLRLSVPPTFLIFWLLPRIESLIERHPDIDLCFVDALTLDPLRQDLDCAIEYRLPSKERVYSEKLFDDEVVPLVAPSYAERMHLRTLEDVRRCTVIETEKRLFSWNNVLRDQKWRHDVPSLTVQYSYHALTCAQLGRGIALANRHNAAYLIEQQRLMVPFLLSTRSYIGPAYYLSWPERTAGSPVVRLFRDWLFEQLSLPNSTPEQE